ncbi:molybdopterin-guanine dinucleotide biosynthesis protein B [Tumebacillus permanentifrigoris]|uniref:Molybdopterin-guanine dinucleotide biosynthesis protein MobB n=1 Tax=Tumebacillus permanentifrigoris TaxID=378543 RepID=A0A316D6A3_9BACL|nr:molybdopterin-guanine dinucleotide biosynthesis protein B [Tumebacillus permanentifrigoris]PWK09634.1 molybdopterin-guanine dinucleotide biosynthesis protein MobB [Tumebacillus permanentifrigoris]
MTDVNKPASKAGDPLLPTVPTLAIVGYKNSGKTTLVIRLVERFKQLGYRVGTCKHDGAHDLRLDGEGTDSAKHRAAGAEVTLVAGREQAFLQQVYTVEPPLEHWLAQLSDPALGLDLILVEGWKHSALPKLVLTSSENLEHLSNVLAYAVDSRRTPIAEGGTGVYDREDIEGLLHLIRCRVLHDSPPSNSSSNPGGTTACFPTLDFRA